jgi:hypothetical protein
LIPLTLTIDVLMLAIGLEALTVATRNKAVTIVKKETKTFLVFIFDLFIFNCTENLGFPYI